MMHAAEEHGFTLVELLVAMALAMIVFGATLTAFDVFQTNNRFDLLRNEAQDNARNAIDRLARELRNVAAPTTGSAGALEQAVTPAEEEKEGKPASIIFQTISSSTPKAGNKNTANAMRVRYCLNDSTPSNEILYRQAQTWETEAAPKIPTSTACPDLTAGDWGSTTQLVRYITNKNGGQSRPLFAYGGLSGVSKIVTVEPTLYLDVNPSQPRPGETQLTSSISLRNANRPPIAAFTATKVNGFVRLNASESLDPDGLALTYQWWEGSTELSTTSQEYNTPEKESNGEHTFKLKVSDPGGLSSETERTVTIP
jgi:prepilin-type N-terminal cleavage/methylation domain-containing protein